MSFTTSPNVRLFVVSPARAGGFDVNFVFQNGSSQRANFLGTVASADDVRALVKDSHISSDGTWILVLDGREARWIAPHCPSPDDMMRGQAAAQMAR